MSFDLYFVPPPPQDSGWGHVMDELEEAADEQRPPTAEEKALWTRIVEAVAPLMPTAEMVEGERSLQLDDGVAIQLTMSPGEISLRAPYWFDRAEAEHNTESVETFASVREFLARELGAGPVPRQRRPRWAFWRR